MPPTFPMLFWRGRLGGCFALVVVLLLAAQMQAQLVGPFLLDTLPVIVHDELNTDRIAVAMGDSVGLVTFGKSDWGRGRAVRIDRHLRLLDTLSLWDEGAGVRPEAVATSGHNFLVAGVRTSTGGYGVCCVLVDADGTVHDPVEIPSHTLQFWRPAVGHNGLNYVVAWDDGRDVYYSRVSTSGQLLDSTARRIAPGLGGLRVSPAVAGHNGYTLVVFLQGDEVGRRDFGIFGNLLLPDGSRRDSSGFMVHWQPSMREPVVVACSTGYLVAWFDHTSDSDTLRVSRVTWAGEVPDPMGTVVTPYDDAGAATISAAGDTALITWHVGNRTVPQQILARRVDAQGRLLDTTDIAVCEPQQLGNNLLYPEHPAVFSCDSGFGVAWSHYFGPDSGVRNRDVVCRRVTRSGGLPDSVWSALSWSADYQGAHYVVGYDDTFFTLIVDYAPDTSGFVQPEWRGMRFDRTGRLLDAEPFFVLPYANRHWDDPVPAACSLGFVALFNDTFNNLRYYRVSLDGRVLDSVPLFVEDYPDMIVQEHTVCAVPGGFLATWNEQVHGGTRFFCRRFTWDGELGDTALSVPPAPVQRDPLLVSGEENVLLLYSYFDDAWFAYNKLNFDGRPLTERAKLWRHWPFKACHGIAAYGGGVYVVFNPRVSEVWRIPADDRPPDSAPTRLPFRNPSYEAGLVFDGDNFIALGEFRGVLSAVRYSPEGIVLDSTPVELCDSIVPGRLTWSYTLGGTSAIVFSQYETQPLLTTRASAFVLPPMPVGLAGRPTKPRSRSLPAIVRGTLFLPGRGVAMLLDVSGRKVMKLVPGENDVRHLSPGVYFVRPASSVERQTSSIRKVILTR